MSNEQRVSEAAERLRRMRDGENGFTVYCPGMPLAEWKDTERARSKLINDEEADKEDLVDAYLAEHDPTPIDEAWLRSIGAEDCSDGVWKFENKHGVQVFWWSDERTVNVDDIEHRWPMETRGELATLCRGLRITLKETP